MKTKDVILRVLNFLPVAVIMLIRAVYLYVMVLVRYCQHGGETIVYIQDRKTIYDVYNLLEKSLTKDKADEK